MTRASSPIVVSIPYNSESGVRGSLGQLKRPLNDRERFLLLEYPTVYIIHNKRNERRGEDGGQTDNAFLPQVYVGETNDIEKRTREHRIDDVRSSNALAWASYRDSPTTRMYVIGHRHFNKSLTLDVENRLLGYVLASDADATLGITNSRGNPQNDYYTHDEFEDITSMAWRKLHEMDEDLFPTERVIKSSAIFKASPFHKLSNEQYQAEEMILEQLGIALKNVNQRRQLILVEGGAGTGKTVLLSHLFLEIVKRYSSNEGFDSGEEGELIDGTEGVKMALIVNHDEQQTVYDAIARRLGLQRRAGEIVFKSTSFINKYSEPAEKYRGIGHHAHQLHPSDEVEVALVDEAHLLFNDGNQGYVGHRNQLWDIMLRARVVIAVFDHQQVLRKAQEVPSEVREILFAEDRFANSGTDDIALRCNLGLFETRMDVANIRLKRQFRIDACDEVVRWIDDFAALGKIGPIPVDTKCRVEVDGTPYEIKVFESPIALYKAIVQRAGDDSTGLSRLLATYDWAYKKKKGPTKQSDEYWAVSLRRDNDGWQYSDEYARAEDMAQTNEVLNHFTIAWNYQLKPEKGKRRLKDKDAAWAEKPHTLREAGSIYTVQGFDLNYAGVIIGPSVQWRDGQLVFDPKLSRNYQAIQGSERPEENLRNELNVLLKRGVHGLYLFAVDPALQSHLLAMAKESKRLAGNNR